MLVEINKLKKGDVFKLNENSKTIFVYDGYNRHIKKYEGYNFYDIGHFKEFKKGKKVFTNFEF